MKLLIPITVLQEHRKDQHWKMIMCDSFILDGASTTEVTLYGDVQFRGLKKSAEVHLNNTNTEYTQIYYLEC